MGNDAHPPGVWTTVENGYEKTASRTIIEQVLSIVMQKHRMIVLLSKGYQSGATIFVSIGPQNLVIDRPMDWAGLKRVRVVFKDDAKVWNHFTVKVTGEGKDTVKTEFPTELFRLQRRAHFRIDAPTGSKASFMLDGELVKDITVGNISIGGMMIFYAKGEAPETIKDQDVVIHIEVELAPFVADDGEVSGEREVLRLEIAQGVCVRSFLDSNGQQYCLGVMFKPRPQEEVKLMQQIRQLELEELRKGILPR